MISGDAQKRDSDCRTHPEAKVTRPPAPTTVLGLGGPGQQARVWHKPAPGIKGQKGIVVSSGVAGIKLPWTSPPHHPSEPHSGGEEEQLSWLEPAAPGARPSMCGPLPSPPLGKGRGPCPFDRGLCSSPLGALRTRAPRADVQGWSHEDQGAPGAAETRQPCPGSGREVSGNTGSLGQQTPC